MSVSANATKRNLKRGKTKSILMSFLNGFSKKKSCNEECSSLVHPIIPSQMSKAWEIARPYRPCLVLNLETIREEEPDDYPSINAPYRQTPIRTPLYFVKGSKARRFRFRRYAKLMWRVHSTRLRCNVISVLRLFRMTKNRKAPASSPLGIIQI